MSQKDQIKLICLQVLGLASIMFGRIPKMALAVNFLADLVLNRWDEIWAIGEAKGSTKTAVEGLTSVSPAGIGYYESLAEAGKSAANQEWGANL